MVEQPAEGKVLRYRSTQLAHEWTAKMGMILFLGSWAMMFGAVFFAYGGVRLQADVWPPVEYPPLPLLQPTLNTVVVAASSTILHLGIRSLRRGKTAWVGWALVATALLGAVFLASQLWVWNDLSAQGLHPSSGVYGSSFFGLTWVHAAHVAVGIPALAYLAIRAFLGTYTPANNLSLRLWAMYWHFVGVVWGFLFLTVYVL